MIEESHLLGDVDGVVTDPLQRTSREIHVQPPVEGTWIVRELQRFEVCRDG